MFAVALDMLSMEVRKCIWIMKRNFWKGEENASDKICISTTWR